jgi:hypothetical protein
MKSSHFYITSLLGFVGLVASVALVILGQSNLNLQAKAREQQKMIAQGNNSNQILQNLLRDLADASTRDEKIKELLAQNGYTVSTNPPAPAQ